ncbi:hypothetical protein C8R48DRAFT_565340, partial [Suillus tomentosus]
EGWVDEANLLSGHERKQLEHDIRPVKLVLVKLRKVAFKLINSTTILLPAWHEALRSLDMPVTLMPRDVATRWNSTFDMLKYALEHRKAVDVVTQCRDL